MPFLVSSILPKNEQKQFDLRYHSWIFCSFFGRIEDTKKTFRNSLTFKNGLAIGGQHWQNSLLFSFGSKTYGRASLKLNTWLLGRNIGPKIREMCYMYWTFKRSPQKTAKGGSVEETVYIFKLYVSPLAPADFEIKVERIAHSIVHFDQRNKLISKM